jgi:exosome complex component MTR3
MDKKRIYGPEETVKPLCISAERNSLTRTDSRKAQDMRSIFIRSKVVPQASGSCFIESGRTKILASVYGPRPVTKGRENHERGLINCEICTFLFQRRVPVPTSPKKLTKLVETG